VTGRAVEKDGRYSPDTRTQEHYVEDQIPIPPPMQRALAQLLSGAGPERRELPEGFGKLLATHAHLGHLDVQPLDNPLGGATTQQRIRFWVTRRAGDAGRPQLGLDGETEVASALDRSPGGPVYEHRVTLSWRGFLRVEGDRIASLLLAADGKETLRWGSPAMAQALAREHPAAHLPAGRPIDLDTAVRYGVIAE
jgi:hypothetical protein